MPEQTCYTPYIVHEGENTVARENLFTMKVSAEERQLIGRLAAQEQRSAADAIRLLIRQAVKDDKRQPPAGIHVSGA